LKLKGANIGDVSEKEDKKAFFQSKLASFEDIVLSGC
jgi:hypothetical protein